MSYQDHLKTCSYCSKNNPQKPTVRIKAASSYRRERKLSELASIIKGVSYPSISYADTKTSPQFWGNVRTKTKGASNAERQFKLKELGRLIRGL
jgi:hypothetical protein